MNSMLNRNLKYLFPIGAVVISGGLFAYGMLQPQHKAYGFPNLFVATMVVLSLIWLATEKGTPVKEQAQREHWPEVLWGLAAIAIYLFAAQWLGFLVSSLIVFFALGVGYSPYGKNIKGTLIAAGAAICFLAVIYCLFNLLLKVQTPEGLL